MYSPIKTFIELMYIFPDNKFLQSMFFTMFMSHNNTYSFLSCQFLSRSNAEPARTSQEAHTMQIRCIIYEQFGHALDYEWRYVYVTAAIADTQHFQMIIRRKVKACCHREANKKQEADDASILTMTYGVCSEKHRKSGRKNKRLSDFQARMVPQTPK